MSLSLPLVECVNYDFFKATTLTDLLALIFFLTTFLTFLFLGLATLILSSFFSLHKYFDHKEK
jgi:hypothetical protein